MTTLSYLPAPPDAAVPDTALFGWCLLVTVLVSLVVIGSVALWQRVGDGR